MKGGEIRPQVILFERPDKSLSLKRYHRCKFQGNFSIIKLFIIHEQRQYSMEKIYTFGFRLSNNPATNNEKLIRTKYIFSTIEFIIHITSILCSRLAKKGFVRISILGWIEFSYCVYLLSIYLYKHIHM